VGPKEWIGIYNADDYPHNLGYAIVWARITCGKDTDCNDGTAYSEALDDLSGFIEFAKLPEGEYHAHLINSQNVLYPSFQITRPRRRPTASG
jgi:hypothetical protein